MSASTWNFGNGPLEKDVFPIGSMYGIFANIYHKKYINQPNVGKYTIHGSYGFCFWNLSFSASKGFESSIAFNLLRCPREIWMVPLDPWI